MTDPRLSQEDRRWLNEMSNAAEPIQLVVLGRHSETIVCEDLESLERDEGNHMRYLDLLNDISRAVREDQLLDPNLDD